MRVCVDVVVIVVLFSRDKIRAYQTNTLHPVCLACPSTFWTEDFISKTSPRRRPQTIINITSSLPRAVKTFLRGLIGRQKRSKNKV